MIAEIITFIKFLPTLLNVLRSVGRFLQDKKNQAWLADLEFTLDSLEQEKTPEEKKDAAKKLAELIRNI